MEILELIGYLDERIKAVQETWKPGDETGDNLSYDIADDNIIYIDSEWNSYDEGDSTDITITFDLKITLDIHNSGYSCMGGHYESDEYMILDNVSELINYLKEKGI